MPFIEEHLDGVLSLCRAEGWPSFPDDPERAIRVLTAPGVTTVIALDDGKVVGFAGSSAMVSSRPSWPMWQLTSDLVEEARDGH